MDSKRLDLLYQYALAAAAQGDFRDRELGPIHFLKYAYLGDLAYARAHSGQTFSGVEWRFHHFGPWAVDAFQRIEPALAAVGAARRTFRGKFQDENVRWRAQDQGLLERLENCLPGEVARAIRRAVRKYGSDTVSLLHDVYQTAPMLRAAPGESLDFRPMSDDADDRESKAKDKEGPASVPEFKRISKTQAKRMRKVLKERLAEKRAKRTARPPSPAPRYDEVYFRGLEWLDSLAGEPIEPVEGRLSFSDEIWHSRARREPELP